jgi:hypothetical protein
LNLFELAVEEGSIRKKYSDLAISSTNHGLNTFEHVLANINQLAGWQQIVFE